MAGHGYCSTAGLRGGSGLANNLQYGSEFPYTDPTSQFGEADDDADPWDTIDDSEEFAARTNLTYINPDISKSKLGDRNSFTKARMTLESDLPNFPVVSHLKTSPHRQTGSKKGWSSPPEGDQWDDPTFTPTLSDLLDYFDSDEKSVDKAKRTVKALNS